MKLLFGLMAGWLCLTAQAYAEEFKPNVDYDLINPPQPTTDAHKVEVREFFWYGCPHCYHFAERGR